MVAELRILLEPADLNNATSRTQKREARLEKELDDHHFRAITGCGFVETLNR